LAAWSDRLFWVFVGALFLWITVHCWDGVLHGTAPPFVSPRNTFGGAGSASFPLYADAPQAKLLGTITALGALWCAYMATLGTKSKLPDPSKSD
jgi:hypothetical protein